MDLTRVLCAVDFSPPSNAALDFACSLVRGSGAELLVLHAKEPPPVFFPSGAMAYTSMPPDPELQVRRDRLDAQMSGRGVNYRLIMTIGDAASVVLHVAQAENVDLIVQGTHGRTGLARLLLGSVAEKVLEKAACPVLTIKSPAHLPPESDQDS